MGCKELFNNVILPPQSGFRIYKYVGRDGVWKKVDRKVLTINGLIHYFNQNNIVPRELYASVGYFLNPHRVKGKFRRVTGSYTDFLFLGSDFLFEIDRKDKAAFTNGLKMLWGIGFRNLELCETKRGYQCRICDFKEQWTDKFSYQIPSNFFHRVEQAMKDFVLTLDASPVPIEFDHNVCDPMRVCRVRGFRLIKPLDVSEFLSKDKEDVSSSLTLKKNNDPNQPIRPEEGINRLSTGTETVSHRMIDKPLRVVPSCINDMGGNYYGSW